MKKFAFQSSLLLINKKRNISPLMLQNPLPGLEVGIPLTICENIFTTLHYGYDITTPRIVALEFGFAYFAYGCDRLFDAYDPLETNENKQQLYEYYRNNKKLIGASLIAVYLVMSYDLVQTYETAPFAFVLTSTLGYKNFKHLLGEYKAAYIALMWTLACYVLPCVIHDGDYSSIMQPLDYSPIFLSLLSTSNLVDAKDIVEDKNNNINTIPVLIGEKNSNTFSVVLLLLSSILFYINPHFYNRPLVNGIYELQTLGTTIYPIISNSTNIVIS
jgi:hypothetical protein